RLAFRFDLNVGDTFDISNHSLPLSYPDSLNIVDSIQTINGLKYIYFKAHYKGEPVTIIEGIGSNISILWKHNSSGIIMTEQYLLCTYKNGHKTPYINKKYTGKCELPDNIKMHQIKPQ